MNTPVTETRIRINVRDTKESFKRTRVRNGPDPVTGKFWFSIDIIAVSNDIYLPISIATGKKPTGFVYQIEGTDQGFVSTADIECRGEGITQVTVGTLVYAKIPLGMTAAFRIRVEMRGRVGQSYRVVIRHINYKLDPSDARYQKTTHDIHTKMLRFS